MKKFVSSILQRLLRVLPLSSLLFLGACNLSNELDLEKTQQTMTSLEGCFSCQFFRIVFDSIAKLASNAYPKMCDISLSLLALGLMAWILWHVFKLITSLREPNLAQFWIQLFQTLFKGGFISILVASKERLYELINTILEPIGLIFVNLSSSLLRNNWISRVELANSVQTALSSGPGFPAAMGQQLENLIYRITLALNFGRIIGLRLMLGSDFTNFWLGLTTTSIFFLMTLFFPLYLIDGLLRLAFVFTLLPLLLVAWVFKTTSHYLKKAWDIFLGAFAQIMVACVFVAICIATFEGFISLRGYGYLLSPTAQNTDKLFFDEANRMSYSFLSFLLIAFYMYNLSKRITTVTAHFTGAPSSSILASSMERVKKAVTSLALTVVAIAATVTGMGAVASAAGKKAKENAKEALSQE